MELEVDSLDVDAVDEDLELGAVEDVEDVEALLDTTYPGDRVERKAPSSVKLRHAHERPPSARVPSDGSWWMSKSREELSAESESRATKMSNTREGRLIRSQPLP